MRPVSSRQRSSRRRDRLGEAWPRPRSGCGPRALARRPPCGWARGCDRPIGASTTPRVGVEVAPHERAVLALDRRGRQLADQARRRRRRCGPRAAGPTCPCRGGARCPGRSGVADAGDLGVAGQQAVDERAVALPGAGVHDEAGRLVDDDHVVVDVDDGHVDRRSASERPASAVGSGSVDLDHVALARPWPTAGDRPLRRRAPRRRRRGRPPRPGCSPVSMATTRSTRSPASAAGDAPRSRRRRDRPDVALGAPGAEHEHGRRRSRRTMSATLNTGHHCGSMKSTTRPPRNPSPSRKARSMRLPSAPPSDEAEADDAERAARRSTPGAHEHARRRRGRAAAMNGAATRRRG